MKWKHERERERERRKKMKQEKQHHECLSVKRMNIEKAIK